MRKGQSIYTNESHNRSQDRRHRITSGLVYKRRYVSALVWLYLPAQVPDVQSQGDGATSALRCLFINIVALFLDFNTFLYLYVYRLLKI